MNLTFGDAVCHHNLSIHEQVAHPYWYRTSPKWFSSAGTPQPHHLFNIARLGVILDLENVMQCLVTALIAMPNILLAPLVSPRCFPTSTPFSQNIGHLHHGLIHRRILLSMDIYPAAEFLALERVENIHKLVWYKGWVYSKDIAIHEDFKHVQDPRTFACYLCDSRRSCVAWLAFRPYYL